MTGIASQELKAILALLAIAVVVARFLWIRGRPDQVRARVDRIATGALVALAAVAVGNYYGWSTRTLRDPKAFDGYDLMHYYLNAKYFDELGYVGLYDAIVIADDERKGHLRRWRVTMVRDLDTSVRKPISTVYARAAEIRGQFSKRRWNAFKNDFRFLQRTMKRRSQERMLNDHGYNGPPLLQAAAGVITNAVPIEYVKLLCHFETLLVLLLFGLTYRTFGLRRTAIAVLWFFCCFSSRWPGVGHGLFRLDWFVALVAACCLLVRAEPVEGEAMTRGQKIRAVAAGVLFAYAALMRIFPLVWLFGLGTRGLWLLATRRRLDRVAALVLATFVVTAGVLSVITIEVVGMRNIEEFAEDIVEHLQPMNLSQQRMGFGIALSWRGEWSGSFPSQSAMHAKWELVGALKSVRYGIGLIALLLLGFTIRPRDGEPPGARTSAFDASALGFIPFYFLLIASHYYWVHRLTVVLHHAHHDDEDRVDHLVGLVLLLAIEAFSNLLDSATHFRYAVTSLTSVLLGFYCAWVIGTRLWQTRRRTAVEPPAAIISSESPATS